jgi:hypothetical protein
MQEATGYICMMLWAAMTEHNNMHSKLSVGHALLDIFNNTSATNASMQLLLHLVAKTPRPAATLMWWFVARSIATLHGQQFVERHSLVKMSFERNKSHRPALTHFIFKIQKRFRFCMD